MKRGLVLVLVMVLGVVGGISWSHAQQPGGSSVTALTGQDYAEIVHLFGRYNQGTDFKDAALWLSIFTDDAVFQPGANAEEIVGQAALAAWRAQNFAARPAASQSRHWNSSWVVTPTAAGVTGRAYYLLVDVSSGQPVVAGSGYYEDVYVKTSDGWRIKRRRAISDTARP